MSRNILDARDENEAPEGYRYEWVADTSWQLLLEDENRRCRMKNCEAQAVAMLRRERRSKSGFAWWAYCGQHLYGRKIEDGVVKFRRLVPKGEGEAQ